MRHSLPIVVCLLVAGCATTTERASRPACDLRSTCFYEGSVRSFEMLDDRTMLVEVGGDRCPYIVEIDGIFCDLGFTSMIAFQDADRRICAVDNAYIVSGPFARDIDDVCRIRDVRAISDDELLERYATAGRIPPLPPTGSGELQVEDTGTEGREAAAESSSPATPQPGEDTPPAQDVQATL